MRTAAEIRAARVRIAARTVAFSLLAAQLLFWCFALGAAFGPMPLSPAELLVGAGFGLSLGLFLAGSMVRRRLEGDALCALTVFEGRRRLRLVVFPEFLTLGEEVKLTRSLTELALADGVLVLVEGEARRALRVRPRDLAPLGRALTELESGHRGEPVAGVVGQDLEGRGVL